MHVCLSGVPPYLLPSLSLSLCRLSSPLVTLFPHRHLQREMENQKAQVARFQQQMKKLDEDIKQNEGLLRRAHIGQKTAKVKILPTYKSISTSSWTQDIMKYK